MARKNQISLIGHTGSDPEVVTLSDGWIAKLSLATDESYTDKNTNQKIDVTEWHPLEFRGRFAQVAHDYIKKGDQLYVDGTLRTYKIQIGDKSVTCHKIIVTNVQKLNSRAQSEQKPILSPQNLPSSTPAQIGYWNSDGSAFSPQQMQAAKQMKIPHWPRGYALPPAAYQIAGVF